MRGSCSTITGSSNPQAITELDAYEGLPSSILLETRVYFADRKNSTTAKANTAKGHDIQVSICFADPPALSYVCIHCPAYPEADFAGWPRVVRSEKQFLLLYLPLWNTRFKDQLDEYYMYQVVRGEPRLFRIPDPGPSHSFFFNIDDYGIYCCGNGEYILVGLTYGGSGYALYSYSSVLKAWRWRHANLEVETRLSEEQMPVATHKVIQLGGSLLGWVDLWKGILVCDVLCQGPHVELGYIPLPLTGSTYYHHLSPWILRDVTCTDGSLMLIEIEHLSEPADEMCDEPYFENPLDILETGPCMFVDWRATIWNTRLSDDGWHLIWNDNCWCVAFEVHGNDILLVEELGDGTVGVSTISDMLPSFPTLSIHGDHIVHMSTSMRLDMDKKHMISIDLSNNTLKALAPYPPTEPDGNCPYFTCEFSSYLRL